mgnify:CR=1 FL=1
MTLFAGCLDPQKGGGGQSDQTYYNGMELLSVAYFQKIRACEAESGAEGCEDLTQLREKYASALCAAQEVRARSTRSSQTPQKAQLSSPNSIDGTDRNSSTQGFVIGPVIPNPPPPPSPCRCQIDFAQIELLFPRVANVKSVSVVQDGKVISRSVGEGLREGFISFSVNLKPLARQGVAEVRFETVDGPVSVFIAQ